MITIANTGVTSVGLSLPVSLFSITIPTVTTTGTLTAVLQSQTGNTVFAAPDAMSGVPSFRSVVFNDLPSPGTNALYYIDGSGNLGASSLSLSLLVPSAEFAISGSPITNPTGTFTITKQTQVAKSVWIGPTSGGPAVPTFRTLTLSDLSPLGLTNGQVLTGVTAGAPVGKTLVAGTNMMITEMAGSFVFESMAVTAISSIGMVVPSYLSVSPATLTTSGTFTISSTSQSANRFLAGPTSGGAAVPTFRAMTYADLPSLADGQLYIGSTGMPPVPSQLTAGSLITITPGPGTSTISSTALGSVTLDMPTAVFDVMSTSGTNTQTLSVTFDTQAPNTVFAGPASGGAATPTFRTLVAADFAAAPNMAEAMGEVAGFQVSSSTITFSGVSDGTTFMEEAVQVTTLSAGAMSFDMPADGRLRYTGTATVFCHCAVTITLSSASPNQRFVLGIGHNGVAVDATKVMQETKASDDRQSTAIHGYIQMSTNDYISLYVGNMMSTTSFQLYSTNVFAMCMIV